MTTDIIRSLAHYVAADILSQPNRTIGENDPLISSGLIDSFHLVDLSLFVEQQFGVRIDDSELSAATFDTLAQLAELIRQRRS
jgi:acyl carrier protein